MADEAMWLHNFTQGPTWLAGVVVQNHGHCSLHVKLTDGHVVHASSSRPHHAEVRKYYPRSRKPYQ